MKITPIKTHKITKNDKTYFVYCKYCSDILHLVSVKAKDHFLQILKEKYAEGMDIEDWYAFKYSLDKD